MMTTVCLLMLVYPLIVHESGLHSSPPLAAVFPLISISTLSSFFYFFQAEAGIRDVAVTGVQTCALRIFLDEYGATNPAEFFAVATECFFEKPRQLKKKHPALYDELKRFYRQDPVNFAWPASPEP